MFVHSYLCSNSGRNSNRFMLQKNQSVARTSAGHKRSTETNWANKSSGADTNVNNIFAVLTRQVNILTEIEYSTKKKKNIITLHWYSLVRVLCPVDRELVSVNLHSYCLKFKKFIFAIAGSLFVDRNLSLIAPQQLNLVDPQQIRKSFRMCMSLHVLRDSWVCAQFLIVRIQSNFL